MSISAIDPAWAMVQRFMRDSCGVVMRNEQAYLLETRLGAVARRFAFHDVRSYALAACSPSATPEQRSALVDALTTHETLFFRDPPFWEHLERVILPPLARSARPIRFWSAACSTGQEPYSLAMLLDESFPSLAARAEILATDVAEDTIEIARRAEYGRHEMLRGVDAHRLNRHFERVGDGTRHRVVARLRDRVRFDLHNLAAPARDPFDCDVVLCRNVLIYFDDRQRASVIDRLVRAARPDGWIGVGTTESLPGRASAPGWYRNANQEINR